MERLVYYVKEDKQIVKQGGLSKEVWEDNHLQEYVKSGNAFGYVGSSDRTTLRDIMLEKALSGTGLKSAGIAMWIGSTDARHLMDGVDKKTTDAEFEKLCKHYCEDAFLKVTIWSHPDHRGSALSTGEIMQKLKSLMGELV